MRKLIILCAAIAMPAVAAQQLKVGEFSCVDVNWRAVPLVVSAQGNKVAINWEGRNRLLHKVDTTTGALRYEGEISQLVYIQTPHHSVVLSNNDHRIVLSDCVKK